MSAGAKKKEDYLGERLPGGLRLEQCIGEGGFAWVYLARDPAGQPCAVKIPYQLGRDTHRRFEREIKVMRALPPSPYRVAYVADGHTRMGVPFLAMEYVDGFTLTEALKTYPIFPVQDACNFMLQLCAACAGLHQLGIADRDLKPDNILVTREWMVKLTDFGLVKDAQGLLKLFEAEDILQGRDFAENLEAGMLAGSPEWIAPEQLTDAQVSDDALAQTDTWTDVYALGLVFYRLLTGHSLFPFNTLARNQAEYARDLLAYLNERAGVTDADVVRPPEVPPALWEIVSRALRQDPRRRPRDASILGQEIEHFVQTGTAIDDFSDEKTTMGNIDQFLAAYARPKSVPPSQKPAAKAVPPPAGFTDEDELAATAIADPAKLAALDARVAAESEAPTSFGRVAEAVTARPGGPTTMPAKRPADSVRRRVAREPTHKLSREERDAVLDAALARQGGKRPGRTTLVVLFVAALLVVLAGSAIAVLLAYGR